MIEYHRKGDRRRRLDRIRLVAGEPKANRIRGSHTNQNCRFPKGGKAYRKKGRLRFKTGRKRDRKRKVKLVL